MAVPTSLSGITMEQYAGITAALADDLPLDAVLAHECLSPSAWRPADAAWKLRLATEGADGPLFQAFAEKRAEAEDWLARPVTPLDGELRAWLSFLGAWSTHAAPFEMLAATGLRLSDVARLQRLWSRRLDEEQGLREQAAEIARQGPGPMPAITVGRVEHRPFPWSRGGAGSAVKDASRGAPREESRPAPEAPPDGGALESRSVLLPSFMQSPDPARSPAGSRSPVTAVPAVSPGSPPAPVPFGGTVEFDGALVGAPLPFEGKAADDVALSRAKVADAAARPASGKAPVAEIGLTGEVPADLLRRIAKGPPPFARPGEPAPPAPPAAMPSGTVELPPGLVQRIAGAPLPFKDPPPAPAPQAAMPSGTVELPPGLVQRIAGAPLPFRAREAPPAPLPPAAGPAAAPAQQTGGWTLEQYASYRAELAVFKERCEVVLARYGLSDPARRTLVEQGWEERLRRAPEERARWQQLHRSYVGYWAARAGGSR